LSNYAGIMLDVSPAYYAQNYADIIGTSLTAYLAENEWIQSVTANRFSTNNLLDAPRINYGDLKKSKQTSIRKNL